MAVDRSRWVDIALVVALTAVGLAVTLDPENGDGTVIDSLLVPLVTFPVYWWRRAPLPAAVALGAGMVLSGIPTFDQIRCGFALPAALLIGFSLAARSDRGPALMGLAAIEAGTVFMLFTDPQLGPEASFVVVLVAAVWGAGRVYGSRSRLAGALAERTEQLERTRNESAELAVEVERAKLGADLDASARERVRAVVDIARRGEAGAADAGDREAFERIEREGRESLNEMREMLGVLRSDERDTSPRPTLDQLETLLQRPRAGGRPVELSVEGSRRPLSSGLELAAYRVVQHALEGLGAADGEPASVTVTYLDSGLRLELHGTAPEVPATESALGAARERATAQGGSFTATPDGTGKMTVRAELPAAAGA